MFQETTAMQRSTPFFSPKMTPQTKSKGKKQDPIFARIEAHRKACEVADAAGLAYSLEMDDALAPPKNKAALKRAMDKSEDAVGVAFRKLCRARPTTRDGLKALVGYVAKLQDSGDLEERFAHHIDGKPVNLFYVIAAAIEKVA